MKDHCEKCKYPLGVSNPPSFTCWNTCPCHTTSPEKNDSWLWDLWVLWDECFVTGGDPRYLQQRKRVESFISQTLQAQKEEILTIIGECMQDVELDTDAKILNKAVSAIKEL